MEINKNIFRMVNIKISQKSLVKYLFVLFFVVLFCASVYSFILGYAITINKLIDITGQKYYHSKIFTLVNQDVFSKLQLIGLIISLVYMFIIYRFDTVYENITDLIISLFKRIQTLTKEVSVSRVKYLLIMPVISSIYYAVVLPVSLDEAYMYLNFTSKSILTTLLYYPAPNNHILHTLITNITYYIPLIPPLFALRISNIIISLIVYVFCYSFIIKYYKERVALVVVGVSSMLFMNIYYSCISRGYGLINLFVIILLFICYELVFNGKNKKYWGVYCVISVLAFYTMPSFLYFFVMINIYLIICSPKNIIYQVIANIIVLLLVLFLYSPILLVNGLAAFSYAKPLIRSVFFSRAPEFVTSSLTDIFGIKYYYLLPIIMISLFYLMKNKMKNEVVIALIFIFGPLLLLFVHGVIPYPRTFNYYGIIIVFLIVVSFGDALDKIKYKYITPLIIIFQICLLYNFQNKIREYESISISSHELCKKILHADSIYFNALLFENYFTFEQKSQGLKINKATYNFPPKKINADNISGYDYIVIDKSDDMTIIRKPKYTDEIVNIYSK